MRPGVKLPSPCTPRYGWFAFGLTSRVLFLSFRALPDHRQHALRIAVGAPGATGPVHPASSSLYPYALPSSRGWEPWDSRVTPPLPYEHQRRSAGFRPTGSDGSPRTREAQPPGLAGCLLLDAGLHRSPGARAAPIWRRPRRAGAGGPGGPRDGKGTPRTHPGPLRPRSRSGGSAGGGASWRPPRRRSTATAGWWGVHL